MRFLLISVGSRGDIEPFIAMGELLTKREHEVYFAFPDQLCYLVPDPSKCYPLSKDFIELIESAEGRSVMTGDGTFLRRITNFYRVYKKGMQVNKKLVVEQKQCIEDINPDRIVYHPKCSYPILYGMLNRKKNIMVSPVPFIVHPHKDHPNLGFGRSNLKWWNSFSYRLGNLGMAKALKMAIGSINNDKKISSKSIIHHVEEEPFIYLVSPTMYQGPSNMSDRIQVLGFQERALQNEWKPDEKLLSFFKKHPKVLLLTFGSMINTRAAATTLIFLEVFAKFKIPAIIVTGFGGLTEQKDYKENPLFYFTGQLPFSIVFPEVYAVIHHGGAGTTQSALKHGCASLIIPHLIDQFMWNEMIAAKGAGPKGVSIKKLSKENLEPLVKDLWEYPLYKKNAIALSAKMKQEHLEEALYHFLSRSF
jgi:UDP:flavonoid glycosyltransferase YjiC (YdhE family)